MSDKTSFATKFFFIVPYRKGFSLKLAKFIAKYFYLSILALKNTPERAIIDITMCNDRINTNIT